MITLYRKYRPQSFNEVVGQNHIKITLQNEIQKGKVAHAYLFCGPRAVGKTTLARVFAKSVNCLNRKQDDYEPCNKCDNCKSIANSNNFDVIEIDAASHTGVDNVRDNIIASARVSPSQNKYKVFIIDEVHMLSISAFNALLKIMEEPPEYVIFILCTTESHKVPTTIISRCQRFDFKKINVSDVVKKLSWVSKQEDIKISKEILEQIARHSEGHMRDAESLLGQIVSIGGKEITREEADLVIPRSDLNEIISIIEIISRKDASTGISIINKLVEGGVDLKAFLNDLIEISRKILISKINPSLSEKLGIELGENLEMKLNEASKDLSINQIISIIDRFIEAKNNLKNTVIPQLPLEIAIIELCYANNQVNSTTPGSIISPSKAATPPRTNSFKSGIALDDIMNKWTEVLVKVKKFNHSLSFILRACEPRGIEGDQICLAFKYKFHKDRVDNQQIKTMIENVLLDVFNKRLIINSIIDESMEIKNGNGNGPEIPSENIQDNKVKEAGNNEAGSNDESNDTINNILKTFGGKVVK